MKKFYLFFYKDEFVITKDIYGIRFLCGSNRFFKKLKCLFKKDCYIISKSEIENMVDKLNELGNRKLLCEEVLEIYSRCDPISELAEDYSVSKNLIKKIKNKSIYKDCFKKNKRD